jgi:hypothetical protein
MSAMTLVQRPTIGPIEPQVFYPLVDLQSRSGLGVAALRTMRREGLPVRYAGGRGFILGRDFIEHVMQHGKSEK